MFFIPAYILLLGVIILTHYGAALLMDRVQAHRRRLCLIASIVLSCLVLFFFKYFNFFNANLARISAALDLHYPVPVLNILLPLGLSFHTFQSLSYVIEVYWRRQKPERHLGIYALYVMFYPQLVAGPIERPGFLQQFYEVHAFDYRRVTDGLKLMAWGMIKKVVVADRLAILVNHVYATPEAFDGTALAVATIFFAFQIYCDFSGYSDIAVGTAQVMGFRLTKNFDRPYFAPSVAEFWRRWHISLSTWFRDYVYIPLGGSRCGKLRCYGNVLITFAASGLWHGANWTFVVWGILNGLYLVCSMATREARLRLVEGIGLARLPNLHHLLRVLFVFAMTCVAWTFFRADNLRDASQVLLGIISRFHLSLDGLQGCGLSAHDFAVALISIGMLLGVEGLQGWGSLRHRMVRMPLPVRWGAYLAVGLCIFNFGKFTETRFIYFQF